LRNIIEPNYLYEFIQRSRARWIPLNFNQKFIRTIVPLCHVQAIMVRAHK